MSVYACSDLHGCLDYYKAIKEFLKPEDKVYFLGDAGDRGPEPWETIKAIARDPQFIYIKGNHEDMLAEAMKNYLLMDNTHAWRLLVHNGGSETFDQVMGEEDPLGWANWLDKLPTKAEYTNAAGEHIYLCHAGFTPWLKEDGTVHWVWDEDLLWDRDHYFDNDSWGPWGNAIVVHGHTPIPYLWEDLGVPKEAQEPGAFWYADGRKLDIDTGAVWTGHCVLVNLDTWEEHIFED